MQEAWLAKLGHWGDALRMYDARLALTPRDGMAIAGKVRGHAHAQSHRPPPSTLHRLLVIVRGRDHHTR